MSPQETKVERVAPNALWGRTERVEGNAFHPAP